MAGVSFNNPFLNPNLEPPKNPGGAQSSSGTSGAAGTAGVDGGAPEGVNRFSEANGGAVYSFSGGSGNISAGTGREISDEEIERMLHVSENLQNGVDDNIQNVVENFENQSTDLETNFSTLEGLNNDAEVVETDMVNEQQEAEETGEDIKENAMTMEEAQGQIGDIFAQKEELQNKISEKVQGAGYDDISKMQEEAEAKQKEIEAKTEELKSLPEGDPRKLVLAEELDSLVQSCGDIQGVMSQISELQSQMTDLDAQLYDLVSGFEENQEFQESLMNEMDGIEGAMGRLAQRRDFISSQGESTAGRISDGLTTMATFPLAVVSGAVGTVAAASKGNALILAGNAIKTVRKSTGRSMINKGKNLLKSSLKGNILKNTIENHLGTGNTRNDALRGMFDNHMNALGQRYNDAQNALRNGMGFEYNGESYTMGDVYTDTSNFVAGNLDGLNGAINEAKDAIEGKSQKPVEMEGEREHAFGIDSKTFRGFSDKSTSLADAVGRPSNAVGISAIRGIINHTKKASDGNNNQNWT